MKKIIVTAKVEPTFLYQATEKLVYWPLKIGNHASHEGKLSEKFTTRITRPVLIKEMSIMLRVIEYTSSALFYFFSNLAKNFITVFETELVNEIIIGIQMIRTC